MCRPMVEGNKRIALFIGTLTGGGAERVVSRLTHILSKEYDVWVFLIDGRNQAYKCSCPVVDIGGKTGSFRKRAINSCLNLRKYIKEYKIDSVISFLPAANVCNILFAWNAKRIISIRSCYCKEVVPYLDDGREKEYKKQILLQKTIYKLADAIVAVSKTQANLLVSEDGIKKEKVFVIENPYDIEHIKSLSEDKIEKGLQEFTKSHDVTIAVGRITYQKNYPLMLKLFSELVKINPKSGLLILGTGDIQGEIEKLIVEYGINNNVRFAGYVENPFAYMSKCKAYISTSRYEGFPNAMVEAMICGLPVIATDCYSGPRDILDCTNEKIEMNYKEDSKKCGVLLPNDILNNYDTMLEYIGIWKKIITEKEYSKMYEEKGYERIKYFNDMACLSKWSTLFETVI